VEFFLSYNHNDKATAGQVAQLIETHGDEAFRAHDTIDVSDKWREEILSHLDSCSALVAIVTENFVTAPYPNQEVGIVIGKDKPVFSLKYVPILPGFLEMYQAIDMQYNSLEKAVEQIVRTAGEKVRVSTAQIVSPIAEKADRALAAMTTRRVQTGLFPSGHPEAYRRIVVKPEKLRPGLISPTADQWLNSERPRIFDWADPVPRQNGVVFDSSGSPRYAEVSFAGEVYYGETFPKGDHLVVIRFVEILAQSLDYAVRIYKHFGYKGRVVIELKLLLPELRGWYLADMGIKALFSRAYKPGESEIRVERTVGFNDLTKDAVRILADMLVEFCRAFGFSFDEGEAKKYVGRSLGQLELLKG
jgi:hypothetical protein